MKPIPQDAGKKPRKDMSQFDKQRVSEDTEREMTGRPQKYGAAMPDDEPGADISVDQAQGATPTTPPDDLGKEPEQQGLEEGMPGEPDQAQSREQAEQQVSQMPNTPDHHHALHAKHHGNLHDIHKRLSALEQKNGGGQPAAAPAPVPGGGGDDDGY